MLRYVTIGSELIEIFPTPNGLHSFIPNIANLESPKESTKEINNKLEQIVAQNDKIIELLEQIETNTRKGKPPKDKSQLCRIQL